MRPLAIASLMMMLSSTALAQAPEEGTFRYVATYEPRGSDARGYLNLYEGEQEHRLLLPSEGRPAEEERLLRVRYRPRARRVRVAPVPYGGELVAIEVSGEPLHVERLPVRAGAFRAVNTYDTICAGSTALMTEYVSLDGATRLFLTHRALSQQRVPPTGRGDFAIIRYFPLPVTTRRFSPYPCMGAPPIEREVHGEVLAVDAYASDEAEARARLRDAAP